MSYGLVNKWKEPRCLFIWKIGKEYVMSRDRYSSGALWEGRFGYSRAVRVGDKIFVAGTTSVDEDGKAIGIGDPYRQAMNILKRIDMSFVGPVPVWRMSFAPVYMSPT